MPGEGIQGSRGSQINNFRDRLGSPNSARVEIQIIIISPKRLRLYPPMLKTPEYTVACLSETTFPTDGEVATMKILIYVYES